MEGIRPTKVDWRTGPHGVAQYRVTYSDEEQTGWITSRFRMDDPYVADEKAAVEKRVFAIVLQRSAA